MDDPLTNLTRYRQRYLDGDLPWDDVSPPPEVIELAAGLVPGRALDLGCGYGRTSIYLAQRGWTADGVDFVREAVDGARARANTAGVEDRARFFASSVTAMPFLFPPYDLAIDIGCVHSLDEPNRRAYYAELVRLLSAESWYLLFARLADGNEPLEDGPRGLPEATIVDLFSNDFELMRSEQGSSQSEGHPAWPSGWFWFRRR